MRFENKIRSLYRGYFVPVDAHREQQNEAKTMMGGANNGFFQTLNHRVVCAGWLPGFVKVLYFMAYYRWVWRRFRSGFDKTRPIRISFLMISLDLWKFDAVVRHFLKEACFEVKIIICPFSSQGSTYEDTDRHNAVKHFQEAGLPWLVGAHHRCDADAFLESSDVVFYFNPNNHTISKYMYFNWMHKLTCFNIYSYRVSSIFKYEYGSLIMKTCWRNYVETAYHKELSIAYGSPRSSVVVAGFPKVEDYAVPSPERRSGKFTVLYAPHWTIKGVENVGQDWATFLDYQDTIVRFCTENKDKVALIIKPHPLLRSALELDAVWGKQRTDAYFDGLLGMDNIKIALNEGYTDLFKRSDVMVHDSGGFLAEYLLQYKPCALLTNEDFRYEKYNDMGKLAISVHQRIENKKALIEFLTAGMNGQLRLHERHQEVVDQLFENKTPSRIIAEDLKELLWTH